MGDPRLLAVSEPVARFGSPELTRLLTDMRDTMRHLNGAGLAAPQIGVNTRVVIFGFEQNPRYPDAETVPDALSLGPIAADAEWNSYRTDGGIHRTYWVSQWPRLPVGPLFMTPLLFSAHAVHSVSVVIEPILLVLVTMA